MSYGIAEIKNRPVVFTSTFLGKNPLTRQTRRTFNRSRANMNAPIRNTFIVFCWNQSETILLQGSPELLICLLYMRRRALGRDCFWTGCPEIKRCEDSKRILKNHFASRLAELDTTPKLLRITDQWYIVPVEFRLWRNRDFFGVTLLPLAGGPKDRKPFDADWRLFISSASFHTSSDNCERNTQKWNSSNRDYKKETIETWKWLRRFCGIKLREAECFATTRG